MTTKKNWNRESCYFTGTRVWHKGLVWEAKMDLTSGIEPGLPNTKSFWRRASLIAPMKRDPVAPTRKAVDRAYSTFAVKSVNNETRVITGIASTPTTDRVGDVVVPEGAKFSLPLPLLWQHDHSNPIGKVTKATVTPAGIQIVAEVGKDISSRIDEAWKLIREGIVRGLSIGFRALESSPIPNSRGTKFSQWEWYELSCVSVPANQQATITAIKQADSKQQGSRVVRLTEADKKAATRVVKLKPADRVVKLRRAG